MELPPAYHSACAPPSAGPSNFTALSCLFLFVLNFELMLRLSLPTLFLLFPSRLLPDWTSRLLHHSIFRHVIFLPRLRIRRETPHRGTKRGRSLSTDTHCLPLGPLHRYHYCHCYDLLAPLEERVSHSLLNTHMVTLV
ncbi:uncharacterized protein PV07_12739 [Cladophialophora immunda]|uniref:Uncharacterized protein n=1 Tax=Cladophialophora immunda TaxID=569365 RepID=A0A0D2AAN7_9EURO|nr:uncharacterized protein PV07_12739 [Cladophialophora immunda]KIW21837.1 hypothetical protein PV07_12739 [Cladophialophora immunda]